MLPLVISLIIGVIYSCLGQLDAIQSSPFLELLTAQSGNAAHTSIVLCGVITTLLFFNASGDGTPQRFGSAALLALALLAFGALLQPYCGLSKSDATPSWALYSAALCVVLFAFLYWLIDLKGTRGLDRLPPPAAANPLFIYMLPNIVWALMKSLHLALPEPLTEGAPGLIWAVAYAFLMLAAAHRMRLKLQL